MSMSLKVPEDIVHKINFANLQNIPSHAEDIRHMFRATPGYVLMSSDYSSQEPRLTAYVSGDPKMIEAFQKGRDIYATIASVAFKLPYEKCLEFNPDTGEYQADGKARRSEAKSIVLGELLSYAPSTEALVHRLLSENFVNFITQRCVLHY